jgi:hypothetical protein
MLLAMCPGIIVPRLPEKQAMGRFEHEFIERRRAELERFLVRIAMHPDLARSGPFLEFCTTATAVCRPPLLPVSLLE